ncbi:MAG: DNA-directed RNA polymerase subunit beta' [Clostridia bacterium]|nr:DNA-directed RNA polymerase subunit beta' [Clostridia bacterium]
MLENSNFSAIKIRLASPDKIRGEWSHGEVTKPETINYRSLKPDPGGLFCEKIFGPQKDYECRCGKYKKTNTTRRPQGHHVCETCGVEITKSSVRREYMGHIELAAPVVHLWYLKGTPCYLKLLLEMSPKDLEHVIYFAKYTVLDPGSCCDPRFWPEMDGAEVTKNPQMQRPAAYMLEYKQILDEKKWTDIQAECKKKKEEYPDFVMPRADMGAAAIQELLRNIDLEAEAAKLREEAKGAKGQKHTNAIKRLEVIEAFISSGNRPEWVVMDALPVIPPDLRPMVQLDGGRFATSDLNDLYRKVITRNNRLKKSQEIKAPGIIIRCEMRILQEAVDALIDNGRRDKRPTTGPGNRPLKSLTSMLKGKQGRFRQNLLGKRVDYSGRSVIVVGPELKMYQCGLPKEMALELFRPFVIKRLTEGPNCENVKTAKLKIERANDEVWEVLEQVIKNHPVLLNRAPTLHRLGIQAFEPVLVEGRALKLHPLVCTAYNADFDGDQMAVHVPLSIEAQAEARFLMLASNNILKPQDGKPVVCPTQDMVLGCYYLTSVRENPNRPKDETPVFYCPDEALYSYQTGNVTLQEPIRVCIQREIDGQMRESIITATVGKLIFNRVIPQDLGYVDRSIPGNEFALEIDFQVGKKHLSKIIDRCYRCHGATVTSQMLDSIKSLGFKYSTRGGITVGYKDITVPEQKKVFIAEAEEKVAQIEAKYKMGLLSAKDRKRYIVDIWKETTETVANVLMNSLDPFNPINMMADSGARGSKNQIAQLAGMRGLMNDTSGDVIEVPIKANFREGLTVLEFFVSSHGARKGLADTALRTADSGYLTRRLVDVSQDVIVREDDCFEALGKSIAGTVIETIYDGDKVVVELGDRILGRYTAAPVFHPETGEMIIDINQRITMNIRDAIVKAGVKSVKCRTVFNCQCEHGVCRKCYGDNLATGNEVDIGEAVGIIAAQAIGEPGTQLTMRTFHTGGVASASDITSGLPRVEEIFEARKPKGVAVLSEIEGVVSVQTEQKKRTVTVTPTGAVDASESRAYTIPVASRLRVKDGDTVLAGEAITEGALNPNEVLKISGPNAAQTYLLNEVHKVYSSQGVDLADKHIEIIIRQMMRKVQIEDAGDTNMLPGELTDRFRASRENDRIAAENERRRMEAGEGEYFEEKAPALITEKLLGITKAALATDSFLSAAAFQETTRILTDAAIKGKTDPLVGLKENIIIGKLIPAGIGMKRYRDIDVESTLPETPAVPVDAIEDSDDVSISEHDMSETPVSMDGFDDFEDMFDSDDIDELFGDDGDDGDETDGE